jgi:hypothetical protein
MSEVIEKQETEAKVAAEAKKKAEADEARKKIEAAKPKVGKRGQVPTFQINIGDPFIDGTIRFYKNAGGKAAPDESKRPFALLLLASDPAALATLENYIIRCGGACDLERVGTAKKAISVFEAYDSSKQK